MGSNPNFRTTSEKSTLLGKINKLNLESKALYNVNESALILNKSVDTITNWCKKGKLPALPQKYGNKITFNIPKASLILYLKEQIDKEEVTTYTNKKQLQSLDHKQHVKQFEKACKQGLITKKPFSPRTIHIYLFYLNWFLDKYGAVNKENLKQCLLDVPVTNFAKRKKIYETCVCFTKYLVKEKMESPHIFDELRELTPKRHIPPKKFTVDETDIKKLLDNCSSPLDKVIVKVLSSTGIRASEFCDLCLEDIDFEKQVLTVKLGKGGKRRLLGLSDSVTELLKEYVVTQKITSPTDRLFYNAAGKPLDRWGLSHRLEKIGKKAGVKVSPHALRRAFVTINANKGHPLPMLQIACGHSDITTTRSYCMTTEQEVIEAMKRWD